MARKGHVGVFDLKDSGKRQGFSTGAVRDIQDSKGRFDLNSVFAELFLARIMEAGQKKYGARNWEKGIPIGRFLDSLERHLKKYKAGLRDEPHLSQVIWNGACAAHTAARIEMGLLPKCLFDLPNQVGRGPLRPLSAHEREGLRVFLGIAPGCELDGKPLKQPRQTRRRKAARRR